MSSKLIDETSSKTVILLFFCLLFLILLLLFLYKKLNKQTDGEYTISNMVLGEGGLRDRVRDILHNACLTHFGVRLWADRDDEQDSESGVGREEWGEEGEEHEQGGDSRGSASDEEDDEEEEEEEEEEAEEEGRRGDGEDVQDGRASVPNDKNPANENTQLIVVVEQTRGDEKEELVEVVEEEEKAGSNEGEEQGPGLMINLKQFSGGAMWSEDDKDDGTIIDLTVL